MRTVRCGLLAIACAVCAPGNLAHAQDQRPNIISAPGKKAAALAENNQYAFEVRCTPLAPLKDPSDFVTSRNRSLFVLIAPNGPSRTDQLPADALAAVQVYSIGKDKDTKQQIIADNRNCIKDFLVNGSKKVGFVVTENWIDNFSDSAFGQTISGALALISPLFSLFTGGAALPALVVGKIANIGTAQTNVQNIFSALSRGQNYTHPPIQQLRVGQYKISTEYALVVSFQ
jgi:hypothetical protein